MQRRGEPWRERVRELRGLGKEVQFEIGHQIEPTGSGEGGSHPDGRRESVSGRGHRAKAWRGNVPGRFQEQYGAQSGWSRINIGKEEN